MTSDSSLPGRRDCLRRLAGAVAGATLASFGATATATTLA
jgi:hypothetical protein